MSFRKATLFDAVIENVDRALTTIAGTPPSTGRNYPAQQLDESKLSKEEKRHVAGLMRINHVGEVCAQALYQGQAITARTPEVREAMQHASDEENDHLLWCENRLKELNDRKSLLNPLWYAGSLGLGIAAGIAGDKWSLGFLAETERQVVKHLEDHLEKLPPQDQRSRAIVEQMKIDEGEHATMAVKVGGEELPEPIKKAMTLTSKIMTRTAYYL